MTEFQPSDEKTHPAGAQKYWNESFYFNFFDTEGNWGGATRIGFSPNQGFADGMVFLYFPNGYKGPIYYFEDPAVMGDLARAMLVDLPRKEIELDLEFRAIHEVFDFHESMKRELISGRELIKKLRPDNLLNDAGLGLWKLARLPRMSRARHYEHAGRIEGRIRVDGQAHGLKGFGQRDHSWGVRDMRVLTNWRWFSGQFGDELCFNAIKAQALAFRASGGYVFHRGKAEALKNWSFEAELDESGRWARKVSLLLVTQSDKRFNIRGTAMANIPVRVNTGGCVTVVNEARSRFSWDGNTGYGISEFMGQL